MKILTTIKEYAARAASAVKSNPSYFASILAGLFVLCAMAYAASRRTPTAVLTTPSPVVSMDACASVMDAALDVFEASVQDR